MKSKIIALFLVAFTTISMNAQKTVSGVKVDEKLSLEGKSLTLNGAGLREKCGSICT